MENGLEYSSNKEKKSKISHRAVDKTGHYFHRVYPYMLQTLVVRFRAGAFIEWRPPAALSCNARGFCSRAEETPCLDWYCQRKMKLSQENGRKREW